MTRIDYAFSGRSLHLRVTGHAAYDTSGKDIVCAAVSILCYTLAAALEQADERGELEALSVSLMPGDARIEAAFRPGYEAPLSGRADTILTGFRLLADTYRDNVTLSVKWGETPQQGDVG